MVFPTRRPANPNAGIAASGSIGEGFGVVLRMRIEVWSDVV
jgi:hypothetical protein